MGERHCVSGEGWAWFSGSTEISGAVGVEGGSSGCVDIGVTDARSACEYGGHAELDAHVTPYSLRPS